MGYCVLCEKEKMWYYNLCDKCLEIQKIVKLYGTDTVINTFKIGDEHAKRRLTRSLTDTNLKKN